MPGTSAGVTKSWITRKGGAPQQAQGSNQASRPRSMLNSGVPGQQGRLNSSLGRKNGAGGSGESLAGVKIGDTLTIKSDVNPSVGATRTVVRIEGDKVWDNLRVAWSKKTGKPVKKGLEHHAFRAMKA